MAVYTRLDATDIIPFVHEYNLGTYESHSGITEGVENTNYLLVTDKGRYILTVFEKRVRREDLPYIFALTGHLRHAGITVPDTYADKAGQQIGSLRGKPASIIRFLNGSGVRDADITPAHCAQVGELLAIMHNSVDGFRQQRTNPVGMTEWQRLLTGSLSKTDILHADDIVAIDNALEDYMGLDPHHLRAGAVHGDLFPDNVFFENGELKGVIDFYFACNDFFVYDMAITLNAWCIDKTGRVMDDRLAAFVRAYEAARPLTDEERDLFPVIRRAAALRFIATRLYDWVHTPADADVVKKDPLEYVAKLKADVKWP